MIEPRKCPRCGAPLGAEGAEAVCLRCLLALGLDPGDDPADRQAAEAGPDDFPGYRGCGEVYRASQEQPVRREVAIKLLKPGMDSKAVLTRFEAERQALALMNHPNIARVFDAGTNRRGHPFFVMELVTGDNILRFCDSRRLTIRQRLDLFLQVCEGVRHAHLKGIIHRDLKPSNILVSEIDGQPAPKIIDFGIAKAMDHERLGSRTIYTVFDQFIGTPAYMSPEQAGLTGDGIDARSDIYSLGVLLYELLAGRPPFAPERLRKAALDEICRVIREEEPPPPSVGASLTGVDGLTSTARLRLSTARRLTAELRGDLDGIVMKALEKSPDRRYDSANDLAEDIHRHLRHEPVSARPPGPWRRWWKFTRRHKLAVASGVLVFCALAGGLGASLWMGHKEKLARRQLEYRAYLTDMGSACRTALHSRSSLVSTINLLESNRRHVPDHRNWEWYFLNGLCHRELLTIPADPVAARSVAWSADGKQLATAGAADTIKLWDPATGRRLRELTGHAGGVAVVAWEPAGSRLASCGKDKTIRIWNTAAEGGLSLGGQAEPASSLAWSPDGGTLAAGYADGTVKTWDTRSGRPGLALTTTRPVRAVCWHPDGRRLIACGDKGTAQCWEAATGRSLWQHRAEIGGNIRGAVCSPDGREIFTGGTQLSVDFRDAETGQTTHSFWDNQNFVSAVAWSPGGDLLASGTLYDGCVAIRSSRLGGTVVRSLRSHRGSITALNWAPDGSALASASADGTVKLWDPGGRDASIVCLKMPSAIALAWSPDGTRLASGGRRMDAWTYDFTHSAPVALDGGVIPWTRAVAWDTAGNRLATAGDSGLGVWDYATRTALWRDKKSFAPLFAMVWDTGRGRLIAGGPHGFTAWDAATGAVLHTAAIAAGAGKLALSPDGHQLAVAERAAIAIYDDAFNRLHAWPAHSETINSLAWHPGGTLLASGGADSAAKIWDAATGRLLNTLHGHGGPVRHVAWSPDGSRLVTGGSDATVRLWDTATGLEICVFDKPGTIIQAIQGLAWTRDGRRIAISDGEDNLVVLDATPGWQVVAGQPVVNFPPRDARGHQETIRSLLLWCATLEPISDNDSDLLRRLAWVRATSPYAEVRDGPKAVRFAEAASREVGGRNAGILSILAAAHAECGDFEKAVVIQQQAISLVTSDQRRSSFAAELRLYQSRQPCRDESWK
ncbi:MAG: serine/threonine protein kinase [Akkermansiaceae bacterium]|nr:serine/threonine protein kinase [Akkermansiaceae bacterium]